MLTKLDEDFLTAKTKELQISERVFGSDILLWDLPKFLHIISNLKRENRRLRVQLAAK